MLSLINGAESPLWAVRAAGLSGICVVRLIKHDWVWVSSKVSSTDPLWHNLLNGGSVYLLWETRRFYLGMTFSLHASVAQPDCHLHLHLRWADNPYVSGTVHTKDSAPGLIMGAGESPEQ